MTALVLFSLVVGAYDPLAVSQAPVEAVTLTASGATKGREVPLKVYLPPDVKGPAPVLLFSHGLGGSNEGNVFLAEHWARRGYVAVFVQHPGSDTHVWADVPKAERLRAMKSAASIDNFLKRVGDVGAVLDALTLWSATKGHVLFGRVDVERVGMSGHSFGAVTTQAVSGQKFPLQSSFTDLRIKAAVAFSPSAPRAGSAATAFGEVKVPWLLMTGTHDASPIGGQTAASRREVFPALPAGGKYEVVLDLAEHSAFTDRALPGDSQPRNPNHHRVMLAFTTAFFDAYVRGDAAAKAWLDGDGAKGLLEPKDVFQRK
ncbi:MAG: hypothetical protein U0228_25870 [Myxococcaceae bacterium]